MSPLHGKPRYKIRGLQNVELMVGGVKTACSGKEIPLTEDSEVMGFMTNTLDAEEIPLPYLLSCFKFRVYFAVWFVGCFEGTYAYLFYLITLKWF